MLTTLAALALALATPAADEVAYLPTYGKPASPTYAGFADATADGSNRLHYWFVEREGGAPPQDAPLVLWLNGGPGASSLTGLLAEKLGPQSIAPNGTLVDNPDRITTRYHLLTFDNPVGSGYSETARGAYVRSEYEVRTQFVHALRVFFARHPQYAKCAFWVAGESYAGHYIPNIAWEIAVNATEVPLQGVVIGNGMYNMKLQYPTLGAIAYANGLIDEKVLVQMDERQADCLRMVEASPATAGTYCENKTVWWLYSAQAAGELFYYDIGLTDAAWFDDLTKAMSTYLNRADVKAALHVPPSGRWVQSDETGPVGDALLPDWTVDSDVVVERLLALGLRVRMYNGVRDVSSCNHLGNLAVARALRWAGAKAFAAAPNRPWPSAQRVEGHVRSAGLLQFATVLRTGHLVPTVVPQVFAALLDMMLGE